MRPKFTIPRLRTFWFFNKLRRKTARVLLAGVYYIDIAFFRSKLTNFDYVSDACSFEIEDINSELSIYRGAEIGNVFVNVIGIQHNLFFF